MSDCETGFCRIALLLLALCGSNCTREIPSTELTPQRIVLAEVNGRTITLRQFVRRMVELNGDQKWLTNLDQVRFSRFKQQLLFKLVEEELILDHAARLAITPSPTEVDTEIERLVSLIVITEEQATTLPGTTRPEIVRNITLRKTIATELTAEADLSEERLQHYYQENLERFLTQPLIHLLHILLGNERDALRIQRKLQNGEDFRKLAVAFSLAPEGKNGGDLGLVDHSSLPAELADFAFKCSEGVVSPLLHSTYGYHLFLPLKVHPARSLAFEEVREKIAAELGREENERRYRSWIKQLATTARIRIDQKSLAAI